MFINEVVHIVGLSRKSIRYYEENGLLTPTRNKDNKYRIYNEEDIKKLKIIKFLRELDVPINDLKKLNTKEITLKECLNEKIRQIENEEKRYAKVKHMCNEINKTNETIETLNITNYFCEMNKLNKEGFSSLCIRFQYVAAAPSSWDSGRQCLFFPIASRKFLILSRPCPLC